jgi:hypothetical protein
LPAGISILDGRQAFVFCTIVLIVMCAGTCVRLAKLPSFRQYGPFMGVLNVWMLLNILTLTINTGSRSYFWIYVSATPVLWLLYLLAARNLYLKTFSGYPGISMVGKWTLYAGGIAAIVAAVVSLLFPGTPITASRTLTVVTTVDQCLLCGISLFLLLLLGVMARYPVAIQTNIGVHCVALNAILFTQSFFLIVDQFTAFRYAARVNILAGAASALCCLFWALMLSPNGDKVKRPVRKLPATVETRLLGQLESLNGMLLRTVRK